MQIGDRRPAWVDHATPARAVARGVLVALGVPGLILFATSIGFGALARDLGFTLGQAVFLTATIVALPNQIALIDELARGAALASVALVVTLASIRLLPMTATLMPLMPGARRRPLLHLAAVHFVAITTWVEGMRRLPALPAELRVWHHLGIGLGIVTMTISGTSLGHALAAGVPSAISAALLLATPLYFMLSLIATSRSVADRSAVLIGGLLGPAMFVLAPGIDLLLTGVIGGTAAVALGRIVR